MKKLLHEMLRNGDIELPERTYMEKDKFRIFCSRLADEIERYYAPLPRDNKGVPYHIGETVYSVDPETEYSAEILDTNASGIIRIKWEDGATDYCDPADIQHEPHQPKVYDADGVEINVGDTVWSIGSAVVPDGTKLTVEKLDRDNTLWDSEYELWVHCHRVSHKEPDSREKALKDMARQIRNWHQYDFDNETELMEQLNRFADRLFALIERGA